VSLIELAVGLRFGFAKEVYLFALYFNFLLGYLGNFNESRLME